MYATVPTIAPAIVLLAASAAVRLRSAGWRPAIALGVGALFRTTRRARNAEVHDRRHVVGLEIMMLAGFKSRWTTPALWAEINPATVPRAMLKARGNRKLAFLFQNRREIRSLDEGHRDVLDAVDVTEIVNANDVRDG